MEAITQIQTDLIQRNDTPRICCKQGDTARSITLQIEADGNPWTIPTGAECAVRYRRPDGVAGIYDTLPDSTVPAVTIQENCLTIRLTAQMLHVPGLVEADVVMVLGLEVLATFSFTISVEPSPLQDGTQDAGDYINLNVLNQMQEKLLLLEAQSRRKVSKTGDTMSGDLKMLGHTVLYYGSTTNGNVLSFRVDENQQGNRMVLSVENNGNRTNARLGGIATPQTADDSANKAYVDARFAETVKSVNGEAPDASGNVSLEIDTQDAVRYTSQQLSAEQAQIARDNIFAAPVWLNFVDVTGAFAEQTEYLDWESYLCSLPDGAWFIGGMENTMDIRTVTANYGQRRYQLIRHFTDHGSFIWRVFVNGTMVFRFDSDDPEQEGLKNAVRYTEQYRDNAEKKIARDNIGAADARINYVEVTSAYNAQSRYDTVTDYLLQLPEGAWFIGCEDSAADIRTVVANGVHYQLLRLFTGEQRFIRTLYINGSAVYSFDSTDCASDWEESDVESRKHIRNRPIWVEDAAVFSHLDPEHNIPGAYGENYDGWFRVSDLALSPEELVGLTYTWSVIGGTTLSGTITQQMVDSGYNGEAVRHVKLFDGILFVWEGGQAAPVGVYRKYDSMRVQCTLRRKQMHIADAYKPYLATKADIQAAVAPLLDQPQIVFLSEADYAAGSWSAPEGAIVVVLEEIE